MTDFSPEHNYKINQIILEHRWLCEEINKRKHIAKKYNRASTVFTCGEVLLIGSEISITAISAALPILLPILPIFAVMAGAGVGCRFISSYMNKKLVKHSKLQMLAESKIKSIEGKFVKALKDGVVTDEEYETIINEIKLYKEIIDSENRNKAKNTELLTDEKKKELMEAGRKDVLSIISNKTKVDNNVNFIPNT